MRCPSCNHDNRADRRFCTECGAALSAACPSCGAPAEAGEKFCGGCGASLVGSGQSAVGSTGTGSDTRHKTPETHPEGERRHLTALFCDLVGSTDIASRLDPEEWHRISKAYQEAAAAAVTRFGGHVDKFLGDGLVCFFGVPQAHEDDAERAVRAGLAIVEQVSGVGSQVSGPSTQHPEPSTTLSVRVGIHTGLSVVAHGGGASKDVFGDTPNIAARVQSVAEPDTVLITAATQRLVAGLFVVEERGAHQLKGVPQPVVLYRVVQPSGVRSRLDVSAGRHTPFVGRQSELGGLADAWERVVEGMGQTVLVQGEAGIGKSRLCYQLREQLGDQPHTWLECRCSPYTAGTPFRPVIELVEQALVFQPADTPADKLGKLRIGLERGGFAENDTVALFAEWLELPEHAGYTRLALNPDVQRRKTLETLAAWNLKLAELQPMVVLVEDLHWCDPSSLELLGRLVAQSATAHVLLVGTARPEFTSPWPARSNLQTLNLSRLTKRQTREMVAALSAARALPETVVESAYESLLKRTRQQLHGRVVDVLIEQFPERVESEPELVGRHAEAAGRSDDAITYHGRAGERAQARSAHAEAIGQFRKAIVLVGTRPSGAGRDDRELSLQLAIGGSLIAARGWAHPETATAYERAAALGAAVGDAARLGVARTGLAISYSTRGEAERGRALAAEALVVAEARGDREQAVIGYVNVATPEHFQGKFASSLAHCERASGLYDPALHHGHVRVLGNDSGIGALNFSAWNLWCLGQPHAALVRAREAVALARKLDELFSLAYALYFETVVHYYRRDVATVRERATEVIALSEAQGFPLWLGLGRVLHAWAGILAGNAGALPEIMDGLALAAETGNQSGAPGILMMLAEAQQAAGQFAEAQGTVATALAVAAQTGQPYSDADLHRLDGDLVRTMGGPPDEAAARYHRALAIAREQGARSFELRAATSLARLWRDQGKTAGARDLLAPIYAWFTEGFDTRDLQDAKALLDELR